MRLSVPAEAVVVNRALSPKLGRTGTIAREVRSPTSVRNIVRAAYVDMMQAGNPAKVERVALQNAASIAALLLTTEALITDIPEEESAAAPAMPHGDMY